MVGGVNPRSDANAISEAAPSFYQFLLKTYPNTTLDASGQAVGLPESQMGNSEVGHLNIGAGRVVYQELTRISRAISDGSFLSNRALLSAIAAAKEKNGTLHLMALLSDGGVHSHIDHIEEALKMAGMHGIHRLRIHAFLDGRDTPPKSALHFIKQMEKALPELAPNTSHWKIGTLTGRYFAMDRDKRWDRTEKAYRAIVSGEGQKAASALEAIRKSYEDGLTDEFVLPTVLCDKGLPIGKIEDGDSLLFLNFRADRARQITRALTEKGFDAFQRQHLAHLSSFVSLTSYSEDFNFPVAFEPTTLENVLGEVLSKHALKQLRVAETEKYAHVTYFFNGGRETPFEGEDRILIPSPRDVKTYDEKPEMSAFEVTDAVVTQMKRNRFDFICVNFANPDMVGHSGIFNAAVKAVAAVDQSLKTIVEASLETGGVVLITSDHGNLEQMLDYKTGEPHTAHTTHPVPFILVSEKKLELRSGIHADIAPTILDLMQIQKPSQMNHSSLITKYL